MSKGRSPKLVASAREHWPIEAVPLLPKGLKGLYVLYDPYKQPIRVGIAGRRNQDIRGRLMSYYVDKEYRAAHTFSVYTFKKVPMFKQVEVLILRAMGEALVANTNTGTLPRTTQKPKRPTLRRNKTFLKGTVQDDGSVKVRGGLVKHRKKRVRIEIGPKE